MKQLLQYSFYLYIGMEGNTVNSFCPSSGIEVQVVNTLHLPKQSMIVADLIYISLVSDV